MSRESCGERVCILFAMCLITSVGFAILIWRCARCFHVTFSQINFSHFSGEALSLPSTFVYFAAVSLLVLAGSKIVCCRKWNSMLVPSAAQFAQQTPESFLSQPPVNPPGIIWLTQQQSKFKIVDP